LYLVLVHEFSSLGVNFFYSKVQKGILEVLNNFIGS